MGFVIIACLLSHLSASWDLLFFIYHYYLHTKSNGFSFLNYVVILANFKANTESLLTKDKINK